MRAYCKKPQNRIKRLAFYAALSKERKRNYHLKRAFGINSVEYDARVRRQDGRCAICKRDEKELHHVRIRKYQSLYVDHDHLTGQIRGLLCNDCNAGLGFFGEDQNRLIAAVEYLGIAQC